jgi:ATP synthase protein I
MIKSRRKVKNKMDDTNNSVVTKDVFRSMLRWQVSVTAIVALLALVISGFHAALSAIAGGLSVVFSAMVASKLAHRNSKDASAILINLLKAEAIKILLVVTLLFVTFIFYKQLVPFALIAGLAAAALFSGAAMSKFRQ